jgi:hypothetical protein
VDDDIGVADRPPHQGFVADVAFHKIEAGLGAQMKQPLLSLAVEQIVNGPDAKSGVKQVLAQDAAEVSQSTRDDNALTHPLASLKKSQYPPKFKEAVRHPPAGLLADAGIWQRTLKTSSRDFELRPLMWFTRFPLALGIAIDTSLAAASRGVYPRGCTLRDSTAIDAAV